MVVDVWKGEHLSVCLSVCVCSTVQYEMVDVNMTLQHTQKILGWTLWKCGGLG